jgi:hypothetical protein
LPAGWGFSPTPEAEVGVSWHIGQYNQSQIKGLVIDDARSARIYALDWDGSYDRFSVVGEYARASIDLPPGCWGVSLRKPRTGFTSRVRQDLARGC